MPWDFALVLLFFATAVPILGRRRIQKLLRTEQTSRAERLTLYASTAVFQWLAAALVLWRTTARGIPPASLGIAVAAPVLTITVTVLLAGIVLANQLISLRRLATNPSPTQGMLPQLATKLFPQDHIERLAFFALVLTVSICEEVIYRGFAQRAFQDASGGLVAAGIIGSALMFAIAHVYQGRRGLISTLVVGTLFSAIRSWTGSLIPPLAAHFTADLTAGFLAPSKLRSARPLAESESGKAERDPQIKL